MRRKSPRRLGPVSGTLTFSGIMRYGTFKVSDDTIARCTILHVAMSSDARFSTAVASRRRLLLCAVLGAVERGFSVLCLYRVRCVRLPLCLCYERADPFAKRTSLWLGMTMTWAWSRCEGGREGSPPGTQTRYSRRKKAAVARAPDSEENHTARGCLLAAR